MRLWKLHQHSALESKEEVLVTSQSDVGLYDRNEKTAYNKGKITLTTHHLYYTDDVSGERWKLPLETIDLADSKPIVEKGFLLRSDKIVVYLPFSEFVKIAFRKGGTESFYNSLIRMLEQQHWEGTSGSKPLPLAPSAVQPSTSSLSPSKADVLPSSEEKKSLSFNSGLRQLGIAGVMEGSKESTKMVEKFTDIDDVMHRTSSLVENIQRLKRNASSAEFGGGADLTAIESIETTLGLESMAQKSKAGGMSSEMRFSHALAVELHTWMTHDKNANFFSLMYLIPLVELFALFNKARSENLISPSDLLKATRVLSIAVPRPMYSLHQLSSGQMALMHVDDSILLSQLVAVLGPRYTGPYEASIMEASRTEERNKANQERQGHRNSDQKKSCNEAHTSSGVQGKYIIPLSSVFPKREQLKSVNEARLASLLHVSIYASRDILFHLEKKGFLCHVDAGFGARIFYWNIFVF